MSFNIASERPRSSTRIRSKSIPRTISHQLKQHTYAKEPILSDSDDDTSPQAASESSINSENAYPKIHDVDASVLQFLAGLQPPAITPWQDAGPHLDWVPKWWNNEQSQAFKAASIDKKSLNEWDYLEAPWLDRLKCKMSPRKRFTIPQLQILEVQWNNDISPPKVDRQRLAMWMGTRTKHVNIWVRVIQPFIQDTIDFFGSFRIVANTKRKPMPPEKFPSQHIQWSKALSNLPRL